MAIVRHTVTDTAWTAISNAGESGTCWLQQKPEEGRCVVHHSESGSGSLDVDDAYFLPDNKSEIVQLVADSTSDIFYARCADAGETAIVITDLI